MDVLREINLRSTPQSKPADERQVQNSAGGHTFQLDDAARLRRFLTLGVDAGTYYASAKELAIDNVEVLKRMAASEPEVYRLRLDLTGSGIAYQAGDLLYVNASQPDALLDEYAAYFGSEEARTLLKHKELRLLDKTLLRGLAKICDNAELKNLLKISNKKALEQYIHGHDLLDVLRTFDPDKKITLAQLAEAAADINPRASSTR